MRIIIFIMRAEVGGETEALQLASPGLQTVKICSTDYRLQTGEGKERGERREGGRGRREEGRPNVFLI